MPKPAASLRISNTGVAVPASAGQLPPDGIPSLRQRLRLLLEPDARVEEQAEKGWILVTIHIPLKNSQ